MQFLVSANAENIDSNAVELALRAVDPAAMVDLAESGRQLRVSTSMSATQLIEAIDRAGYLVKREQVVLVKSECCGGCGG